MQVCYLYHNTLDIQICWKSLILQWAMKIFVSVLNNLRAIVYASIESFCVTNYVYNNISSKMYNTNEKIMYTSCVHLLISGASSMYKLQKLSICLHYTCHET